MTNFVLWFLEQLPDFLMSEPIIYFVGFFFLFVVVNLIRNILTIHR